MIPLPVNDDLRVAALHSYEILDTPPERAYDDIAALAAQVCGAPMATVSLIDQDRQWFKSAHGIDRKESARENSVCTYTILIPQDEVLEIPDASADDRFSDKAYVVDDPHVRFYAGVPLIDSNGWALGSLCVLDRKPRRLSELQKQNLRALGRQVVAQMEGRRLALGTRPVAGVACEPGSVATISELPSQEMAERSQRALLTILDDERRASLALKRSNRALRMWSNCNEAVIWTDDELGLVGKICRIATEVGEHLFAFIAFAREGGQTFSLKALAGNNAPSDLQTSLTRKDALLTKAASACLREGGYGQWREADGDADGILLVPLRDTRTAVGVLGLACEGIAAMPRSEIKQLQNLADDVTFGIASIRMRDRRSEVEDHLRQSLLEKEALLKEVHHRVKNNLQIVGSLLRLDSRRQDAAGRRSTVEMQGRIRAMAILHETVYRTGRFAKIELGGYLRRVYDQLWRSMDSPGTIKTHLDFGAVDVEMEQATSCGLILNELLTNALKHGLEERRQGDLWVYVHSDGASEPPLITIGVADNGKGLTGGDPSERQAGLGLQLVEDLASQLRGQLHVTTGPIARFEVSFRPPKVHISEGTRITRASGRIPIDTLIFEAEQ